MSPHAVEAELNNGQGKVFLATKKVLHILGLLDNVYSGILFCVTIQHLSQHWRSPAMAYTPPQLPPQLQVYEQPYGPPDANGFPGAGPDGCSFYRSLARQMLGNSNHFWIVQDAVLDHYIRVFIDQGSGSGLHARYLTYDNNFPSRYGPFFPALASPDPAIARPPKEFEGDVLSVICNTFNVRIVVWGNNEILLRHKGSVSCPEYNMKQVPDGTGKTGFRFDTLVPDESGSSLVDHLLRVKSTETPLEIREITWWRDPYNARWTDNRVLNALNEQDRRAWVPAPPEQPREYKCYNEHIPVSALLWAL